MHRPLNPHPQPCDDIRANVNRLRVIWQAMLDEPQVSQAAERIESQGKRTDKD
jgi:hypothetical protein